MSVITAPIHDRMSSDVTLASLLNTYGGLPAVFTTDPSPGDAIPPYIVSAGEVSQPPWDTKTSRGRQITRDVRCYAPNSGSVAVVEAMAERVRALFHRHLLVIPGFDTIIAECFGPIVADERDIYGRIVTVSLTIQEQ
jgi:hypothetical protein